MESPADRLTALFEPVVTAMGYELVGVHYKPSRGEGLVRVYIDAETGINVDDCARVSHQISGVLDVEDPIAGNYRLEISSPGLDRPLFQPEHYQRFAGSVVRIKLQQLLDGRRSFRGMLEGFEDGCVLIEEDGTRHAVPIELVDRANLVPDV